MDKIIRFLIDPIKEGVYQNNYEIRLDTLQEFSYYLNSSLFNNKCEMLKWITSEGITSKSEFKILNLFDMLMKLSYEIKKEDEKYLRYITEIKREYINFQGMLFTIRADPFYSKDFALNEEGLKEDYENLAQYSIINDNNYFLKYLYKNNYYNNLEDLIIIKIKVYPRNESIIIETYNLQESGSHIFTDHLRSIPIVGKNINTFNTGIKHSINNVLELYPTCINLFTEIREYNYLPDKIKLNIKEAIKYHSMEEWRTSVINSSIITELILNEIYENMRKEIAPPLPIGSIYNEMKKHFPKNIQKNIEILNKARISSVHLSENKIKESDSKRALLGAMSLASWHYFS